MAPRWLGGSIPAATHGRLRPDQGSSTRAVLDEAGRMAQASSKADQRGDRAESLDHIAYRRQQRGHCGSAAGFDAVLKGSGTDCECQARSAEALVPRRRVFRRALSMAWQHLQADGLRYGLTDRIAYRMCADVTLPLRALSWTLVGKRPTRPVHLTDSAKRASLMHPSLHPGHLRSSPGTSGSILLQNRTSRSQIRTRKAPWRRAQRVCASFSISARAGN